MALRPTDLQVILQISRDVERLQNLQQQYGRQQQEHLAAYMEKNLVEKKKKTEALKKADKVRLRAVSDQEKRTKSEGKDKRGKRGTKTGSHIDLIV